MGRGIVVDLGGMTRQDAYEHDMNIVVGEYP
jgi:hypothetical protein